MAIFWGYFRSVFGVQNYKFTPKQLKSAINKRLYAARVLREPYRPRRAHMIPYGRVNSTVDTTHSPEKLLFIVKNTYFHR